MSASSPASEMSESFPKDGRMSGQWWLIAEGLPRSGVNLKLEMALTFLNYECTLLQCWLKFSDSGKLMKMEAEDSNLCDFAMIEKAPSCLIAGWD